IILRAGLAIIGQLLSRFGPPGIEWIAIASALISFAYFWAYLYYHDASYYDSSNINLNIGIYATVWILALLLSGAYDRIFRWKRVFRGVMVGWLSIAAIYGLLGPEFRPSRLLVLAGGILVSTVIFAMRVIYFRLREGAWPFGQAEQRRYAIVGPGIQAQKIEKMLRSSHPELLYTGYVSPELKSEEPTFLGNQDHLDQIVRFHKLDEIIFCSNSLPSSEIMQWMTQLGPRLRYKLAPEQSMGIIGSSSKNSSGELYTFEIQYNLGEKYLQRNKRLFDLISSIILLLFYPVLLFLVKQKRNLLRNISQVMSGQLTWVTYGSSNANQYFPGLKPGILHPNIVLYREDENQAQIDSDYYYARDYSVWKDLSLLINNLDKIGNQP
ncbi:MAG: hypothetical protein KDC53_16500, partial [Saprospiraceae bacterium]|nr:hypothetical protein [Saprospiraceae bacterium]